MPSELESALDSAIGRRAGALFVPTAMASAYRRQIVDFAARKQWPAMYADRAAAEAGGLMAYGANIADQLRRAAIYVDKILKGAKPADLPVEQPTKFESVINLKTARTLGLTIPQSVLLQADEVIGRR
jgi:putative ABC transport system substrate-binding protein